MTSAQKRGLQQADSDGVNPTKTSTIHPAFLPGGIAQLIDASIQSDRLISFGG